MSYLTEKFDYQLDRAVHPCKGGVNAKVIVEAVAPAQPGVEIIIFFPLLIYCQYFLLDLGFTLYQKITLCEPGSESFTVPCVGGDKDSVTVKNQSELSAVVKRDGAEITQVIEMKRFCFAPISQGEVLGKICYYSDGVLLGETDLIAEFGVDQIAKRGFWDFITSIFR